MGSKFDKNWQQQTSEQGKLILQNKMKAYPQYEKQTQQGMVANINFNIPEIIRQQWWLYVPYSQVQVDSLKHVIGKGAYAEVFKAMYYDKRRQIVREVALKRLKKEVQNDKIELAGFMIETTLLARLNHRNIVKLRGFGMEDDKDIRTAFILLDYVRGGTMKQTLLQHKQKMLKHQNPYYSKKQAMSWVIQLCKAVKHMHNHEPKIVHRDIKLDNILLTSSNPLESEVRLTDFGLARPMKTSNMSSSKPKMPGQGTTHRDSDKYYNLTGQSGSLMYMAPEVFLSQPYNEKADIFSLAIVLLELFTGAISSHTFLSEQTWNEAKKHAKQVAQGRRVPIPKYVPHQIKELITQCWSQIPCNRPSADYVLQQLEQISENSEVLKCRFGHKDFLVYQQQALDYLIKSRVEQVQQSIQNNFSLH